MGMGTLLLIMHGLAAVALLGGLTHQTAAMIRGARARQMRQGAQAGFVARYAAVRPRIFAHAIAWLYLITFLLGAVIYPIYRIEVRIPFEEMSLFWAVGVFEVKEHWGGIGLALLPWYLWLWDDAKEHLARNRIAVTMALFVIVWFDFLAGHVLNNIRGLP